MRQFSISHVFRPVFVSEKLLTVPETKREKSRDRVTNKQALTRIGTIKMWPVRKRVESQIFIGAILKRIKNSQSA